MMGRQKFVRNIKLRREREGGINGLRRKRGVKSR